MPPKGSRLPDATITGFVRWIDAGAASPDPRDSNVPTTPADDPRRHWAFQPVKATPPPAVRDLAWVRNPVDAFVLARLEARGWHPAPAASRAEWLRRVTFDLTGLPPTPEALQSFERDATPDAEATVVDTENAFLSLNRLG